MSPQTSYYGTKTVNNLPKAPQLREPSGRAACVDIFPGLSRGCGSSWRFQLRNLGHSEERSQSRRTQPTTLRQEGDSEDRGPGTPTPGSRITQEGVAASGQEPLLPAQAPWLAPSAEYLGTVSHHEAKAGKSVKH